MIEQEKKQVEEQDSLEMSKLDVEELDDNALEEASGGVVSQDPVITNGSQCYC